MRIAIDAFGGDNAPDEVIKGCIKSVEKSGYDIILVGDEEILKEKLKEFGYHGDKITIKHASTVIGVDEEPVKAIRAKKDSSMVVALNMCKDGEADAVVSAGNTGALFTGATLIVRKMKGIRRAAIASILPMTPPVLLLDSGANVTVTDEYLEQFAIMGSIYMQKAYGISAPRVGLLNNGSESCKGTELQLKAYARLSESPSINFVGNVEANKIPQNACDVLVTDGFTGNILLKSFEGMGKMMLTTMKDLFLSDTRTKISSIFVKHKLGDIKKRFDPTEHGGAPILGISKPVIKAHGSSNANAVKNAVRQAIKYAETGTIVGIARETKLLVTEKSTSESEKTK